jgi:hypothetical protein
MRTPVNPDSLIEQLELFSAPSPELDPVQHHVGHDLEKRFQTDFISNGALHEQSKLIPLSTPRRCPEIAGSCGAGERHVVQVFDLADIDSTELLDFSIDIEQMLASGESLQQDRPKCKVLKFELPAHMKAVHPANLVNSSSSTGKAALVIELRRPDKNADSRKINRSTVGAALDRKKLGSDE